MRHWCLFTSTLLFGTAFVQAFDEVAAKDPSVAEQIAAIRKTFDEKQKVAANRYRAANDDQERSKIREEQLSLSSRLSAKYAELVERYADDRDLFPALQWLADSPDHVQLVNELLMKHHIDNPKIGKLCCALAYRGGPRAEKLACKVAEKSGSDEARGLALLAIGQMLMVRSRQEGLNVAERDDLGREAREALAVVIEKYPNFDALRGTAGETAKALLFEARYLQVGSEVPDLAGEDLEGTEFKLSDYRGRVVLLDFWAYWCGHCMEMVPHLRSTVTRLRGAPFVLIGVNGDNADPELKKKNEGLEITWRSFKDRRGGGLRPISEEWNLQGWPTLYLIDQQGVIRAKWLGSPGDEVLDKEINGLLAEAP